MDHFSAVGAPDLQRKYERAEALRMLAPRFEYGGVDEFLEAVEAVSEFLSGGDFYYRQKVLEYSLWAYVSPSGRALGTDEFLRVAKKYLEFIES